MRKEHEGNRDCWNGWAPWWSQETDTKGIWNKCHKDPSLVFLPVELKYLQDMKSPKACVLASGDNEAAFALAGMGADVTSIDISEKQLEAAKQRSKELGLEINFVRADVTELKEIKNKTFDLVYTGRGAACWISDIKAYYSEAVRILKQGGVIIINEFHPMAAVISAEPPLDKLFNYHENGPFTYVSNEGFNGTEFHWTISERIQALLDAGCNLEEIYENDGLASDQAYFQHTKIKTNMESFIVPRMLLLIGKR